MQRHPPISIQAVQHVLMSAAVIAQDLEPRLPLEVHPQMKCRSGIAIDPPNFSTVGQEGVQNNVVIANGPVYEWSNAIIIYLLVVALVQKQNAHNSIIAILYGFVK